MLEEGGGPSSGGERKAAVGTHRARTRDAHSVGGAASPSSGPAQAACSPARHLDFPEAKLKFVRNASLQGANGAFFFPLGWLLFIAKKETELDAHTMPIFIFSDIRAEKTHSQKCVNRNERRLIVARSVNDSNSF